MNENFLLYKHVKEFSYEMMRYTNNIPRNLMYIKVNMQNCFDNSIKLIRYYIVKTVRKSHVKYEEIVDYSVIESNFKEICSKTRHKNKIVNYDLFHAANINSIYNELKEKRYRHSKYNIFLIKEPKYRVVMSENIKD